MIKSLKINKKYITCYENEVKTLKIKEFIKGRDVSYSTVAMYIKRNKDMFNGHIGRSGNIVLDDIAIAILDKKYPILKPVEIIQDEELRKQLIEAQEKIIELQGHINMMLPVVQEYKHQQYLLEEVEKTANQAIKEKEKIEKARDIYKEKLIEQLSELDKLNHENDFIQEQNKMLKSRTFFERLFNKEKEINEKKYKYDKAKNNLKIMSIEKEIEETCEK